MKRVIGILLAAVIALMTAGCQNQIETNDTNSSQINSSAEQSDTPQVSDDTSTGISESIQDTNTEILEYEDLPTYEYETREISLENDGQTIYGIAYIPQTDEERVPLVISSHGLGGSYRSNLAYAEQLAAHGLAVYCFDFRGGGGSNSEALPHRCRS